MKKSVVKALLDLIMVIVFALLFNAKVLGMTFHEAAGLAIGLAVLVHLGLNYKWVINITKRLFSKKVSVRIKLGYVLNLMLGISFAVIIFSGIMISKVLFVSNTMNTSVNFKSLHVMASYTALILMGVHLGLHWTFIKQMTGKLFRVKNRVVTLTATALLAMVLIVGGGYNFVNSNVLSHFNTGSGMEAHGAERGDRPEGFSGDGGGHLAPESGSDNGAETTLMREQPTAGGSQALSVVTKYLSMMGFVGTLTAVIDWTVINRRRKGRIAISNA